MIISVRCRFGSTGLWSARAPCVCMCVLCVQAMGLERKPVLTVGRVTPWKGEVRTGGTETPRSLPAGRKHRGSNRENENPAVRTGGTQTPRRGLEHALPGTCVSRLPPSGEVLTGGTETPCGFFIGPDAMPKLRDIFSSSRMGAPRKETLGFFLLLMRHLEIQFAHPVNFRRLLQCHLPRRTSVDLQRDPMRDSALALDVTRRTSTGFVKPLASFQSRG